jgi:hypothetical protein
MTTNSNSQNSLNLNFEIIPNNKNENILLDQKRNRINLNIEDSDIEMKSLNKLNSKHIKSIQEVNLKEKKMSIDLNDDYLNNNNNENKKIIGCNCKNSGCLKRYCECFTRMKYCDNNYCQCKNCLNKIENEKERKEAIQNYIMKSPISFKKINLDINNLCCFCKKSNCLKKYCECYQIGIKCSSNCKCIDCKNKNNAERKLFEVNIDDGNIKRGRFYSYDFNIQKEDKFKLNNNYENNVNVNKDNNNCWNLNNVPGKKIQLSNKVIIDNYNIKNVFGINFNSAFSFQNEINYQNQKCNDDINIDNKN